MNTFARPYTKAEVDIICEKIGLFPGAQENETVVRAILANEIAVLPPMVITGIRRYGYAMSVPEFTKMLGLSKNVVHHWERGTSKPRRDQVRRLCDMVRGLIK